MKYIFIKIFKLFLKVIYSFFKLLPTNNQKIVFISRQTNSINIDFQMIRDELKERNHALKLVFLCKRLNKDFFSKVVYLFVIFRQMYHLATSKMAIIDSYCIPVCILKHKKTLVILQLWHSIGKIKKSGYQTLDTPSGRDKRMAELMCMHKNYTNIIAGGSAFDAFYEAGFNVNKKILLHYGLPRIDYLLKNQDVIREKVYQKYPNLKNKKIVYYAPTFRSYETNGLDNILKSYDEEKFTLIVRSHPNQILSFNNNNNIYECSDFKSVELLTIADYVITDYSSICLEAAVLNKKVLFYVYDYERYTKDNGLNLDAYKILPTCSSRDVNDLFSIIYNDSYDNESYQKFRKKYLPRNLGTSTIQIVNYIMDKIRDSDGEK